MKRLAWISAALALGIAAAWLVPELAAAPGALRINAFGWVLETTVPTLLVSLLLLAGLGYLLGQLWHLPRRTRRHAAQHGLEKGLLALAEGDYRRAEHTLQRAARRLHSPAAWLAAASAVRGADADERRARYLDAADDGQRRTRLLIALTRSRLMLGDGRPKEALKRLAALRTEHPRHPEVLRLLRSAAEEAGEWRALLPVLSDLERQRLAAHETLPGIAAAALRQTAGGGEAERIWRALPGAIRQQPAVLAALADRVLADSAAADTPAAGSSAATDTELAAAGGEAAPAERVRRVRRRIEAAIDRDWQPSLLVPWERLARAAPKAALKKASRWLHRHPADPDLLTAMARLCQTMELRGKAGEYYRQALAIRSDPALAQEYRETGREDQLRGEPPFEPAVPPAAAFPPPAGVSAEKSNES